MMMSGSTGGSEHGNQAVIFNVATQGSGLRVRMMTRNVVTKTLRDKLT